LRTSEGSQPDTTGDGVFCDGFESGDTSAWPSGLGGCREARATRPVYSSEGVLHSLDRSSNVGASLADRYVFYFGSRPVASVALDGGSATVQFLSVDHLETPVFATNELGGLGWEVGFEPFGLDWQAGMPNGAQNSGVFLRFPGQWFDGTWTDPSLGADVAYNAYRWYEPGTGRYTRPDPLGLDEGDVTLYAYAISNPLFNIDPEGLVALAPGQKCKGFDKVLRKLQKLKQNCECLKYFREELAADLPGLLDGPEPQLKIKDGPGSASSPCEKDPGAIWIDPKFCRLGYRRDLRNIVLHELAHFADCDKQRFPPGGPVEEGAEAERKCFGTSIDPRLPR
jgi:RHS repeat-associated protein